MALSHRDVFISVAIALTAWIIVICYSPIFRQLSTAVAAGSFATFCLIFAVSLLTEGRRLSRERHGSLHCKVVALSSADAFEAEKAQLVINATSKHIPLNESSLIVSDTLDTVLNNLMRDFVGSWYRNISSSPSFTNELDNSIRYVLVGIRDRILAVDIVEILVSKLVPLVTEHLKAFDDAERAVRGKNLTRNITDSEELDLAIAARYREGQLHSAASLAYADPKVIQQGHLRSIAARLIPALLPPGQAASRVVSVLAKEIVACAVLWPLLQMLSDPDTWNLLMEAYGRAVLQDRKTVKKLRAALDQHASPNTKAKSAMIFPRLAPFDNERKFEKFIRAARTCSHLSDARRFRNEVSSQLKKDSRVEGPDQIYLQRLQMGKKILDRRVASLAAGVAVRGPPISSKQEQSSRLERAPLILILRDASGLSSFMEYMERIDKMSLVQFWIIVDGLRNPLEADAGEDEDNLTSTLTWSNSDRDDLAQISQAYMSRSELKVPATNRMAVQKFLSAGSHASTIEYQKARAAMLSSQTLVLEDMQKNYLPSFKESDIFFKLLSTNEASLNTRQASPSLDTSRHVPPIVSSSTSSSATSIIHRPTLSSHLSMNQNLKSRPDALRNVNSSTDLAVSRQLFPAENTSRRSLDEPIRAPLFDEDSDGDPLSRSIQSLDADVNVSDLDHEPDTQVVQAMEAALSDLIENPPNADEDIKESQREDSPRESLEISPIDFSGPMKYGDKPSISSLGLVNTSSRIGVFTDDDLFPDEEKFLQDEHDDPPENSEHDNDGDIHEAAPGDLGLAEAISTLTIDIDKLAAQDVIVDSLTRKAELTNNNAELRILRKSKASLQREMRRKELQRQQYVMQEGDNSLYGRSSVAIKSVMAGTSSDGREYALYLIEVQRKAGDQLPAATWAIARRYSEFHDLHNRLRIRHPSVRHLDFPRRRVVMKLQKDFLQKRRSALEKYLRELLRIPDACRSRELRSFLSQQAIAPPENADGDHEDRQDIVSRLYSSVTDGVEDFFGNIPVLDQISLAGQNLISAATNQLAGNSTALPAEITEDPVVTAEAEKELTAFEDRELEPFVKPICDIFLELFELNRGNNWFRGRAVVVVLHQLLGGTIERKVRENAKQLVQEDAVIKYLDMLKDMVWPDGKLRQDVKPRTVAEKAKSRTEASLMLATLLPDLAGSVVGRANSQAAARRILATVDNGRLNTHLAYTIFDEIVEVLFGS